MTPWTQPPPFLRYAIVGLLTNLVGYLVYLLLTGIGLGPKLTMSLLYAFGASAGFVGNRQWTFSHQGRVLPSLLRFGFAHSIGYGLNFALLFIFTDLLKFPHQVVQAGAIFVVAGFLFLAFKFFVFPARQVPGTA